MKTTSILINILLLPLVLSAWGQKAEFDPDTLVSGQIVEITGKIRLVGNMPFPQLVITDLEDQDWYIDEREKHIFAGFEQQTMRVRGTVELLDIVLANNRYIGIRRILKQITLLP